MRFIVDLKVSVSIETPTIPATATPYPEVANDLTVDFAVTRMLERLMPHPDDKLHTNLCGESFTAIVTETEVREGSIEP